MPRATGEFKFSCANTTLMRLVLVAGTTATAAIDGLSAAGADPALRAHTPSADAEILTFGRPVRSPVVPVSPTGCPTPAVMTRAIRELLGFRVTIVDAGLAEPTAAETLDVDAEPGRDVRDAEAVPAARAVYATARETGASLPPSERLLLAETIPGGTTTALGVLHALGEPAAVSSSLPDNPIEQKRRVVETGLAASDVGDGDLSGDPIGAIRLVGDPVQAALAGLAHGAIESGVPVTLAGGTQLLAVAAVLRHLGVDANLELATTSFVREDESANLDRLAGALDVTVTATDPGFEARDHPATAAYRRGEAKEGVGMGGALHLAARSNTPMAAVRERFVALADELVELTPRPVRGDGA